MKSKLVLFLVGFIAWLLLNWVPDWQHVITGIFVAGFTAFLTGDLFISKTHYLQHPHRSLLVSPSSGRNAENPSANTAHRVSRRCSVGSRRSYDQPTA